MPLSNAPENDSRPRFRAAIGLLARAPSSGGKTRLAADVPPQRLADLRVALLADAIDLLARTPDIDPFIFYTPADEATAAGVRALSGPHLPLVPQCGDDLGARMRSATEDLLDGRGYDAAILVGTDNPLLTPEHLAHARELLQHDTVVLGPADDGGYYLIGMRRLRRDLFEDVAWGTESVLTDTLRIADRIGAEARFISSGYDIDTIADLRRLEVDLRTAPPDVGAHVRRWFSVTD
jgi:rSAM/selenodomain-associated transferase 1